MNPLHLRLINFGVLRDVDIDLLEGLVGILGELHGASSAIDSNGAGKSTFVNAIVASLYGPAGRTFADDLTRGEDRMEIELTFEQDGAVYRVRRSYRGGGTATVDFERRVVYSADEGTSGYEWEPLTCASAAETQDLIGRTIGMSRRTFLQSVFLAQEDGSFADGTAKEVKELLAELAFGTESVWAGYAVRASEKRKRLEAELLRLAGRTARARELADGRQQVETEHEAAVTAEVELADLVADRERERAAVALRWQAARELQARVDAALAAVRAARIEHDRLVELTTRAETAAVAAAVARDELVGLPQSGETDRLEQRVRDLEAAISAHEQAARAHDETVSELLRADRERAELGNRANQVAQDAENLRVAASMLDARPLDDGATCDRCGQQLDHEARSRALASYHADAARLDADALTLRAQAAAIAVPVVPAAPDGDPPARELAAVRNQLRATQEAAAQRARLEERILGLQRTIAERPAPELVTESARVLADREAEHAALTPAELTAIEAEGHTASRLLEDAKARLAQAQQQRARLDERLAQIAQADERLADAAAEKANLDRSADTWARLEKACGLNGIPALILETAVIPYIETETARVLADLGTPFQVELRTQREGKKDGHLIDTLQTVIVTDTGESPYRKLSGGEKMRANVAFRVAFDRLLGSKSGLLVIDEPRWLDQAGVEALIVSLRALRAEFPRIYVVTQSGTTLRDLFDDVLVVVKDGDQARVEDGVPVEAVAA